VFVGIQLIISEPAHALASMNSFIVVNIQTMSSEFHNV